MDIFEQADVFTPSRAVLQEEEEAATSTAPSYLRPAICVWNSKLLRQIYPAGLRCKALVVATCPTSCALLHALPGKQLLGSLLAPGVSLAGNSLSLGPSAVGPLPCDRVCNIYTLWTSPEASDSDVLLVVCQYDVDRERAPAWARSVLSQVPHEHAVFLGSMAAEQFRGQGDASQEELIFSLCTHAAAQQQQRELGQSAAPRLPTGTIVGGLPAALLSYCQVRALSAELLLMVEMVVEGRAALVEVLGRALESVLRSRGVGAAATVLRTTGVLSAARKALGFGAHATEVYV